MNKQIILSLLFLAFGSFLYAQDVDVKKNEIQVDGAAIARIEKDGCGALSPGCTFYISNTDDEQLITVVAMEMIDPEVAGAGNPEGKVRYLRFSFEGTNQVAEIKNPAMLNTRPKDIAKVLVRAKLIKDGKLNDTVVQNFINANGTHFSDRQKQLHPDKVIIINDHQ